MGPLCGQQRQPCCCRGPNREIENNSVLIDARDILSWFDKYLCFFSKCRISVLSLRYKDISNVKCVCLEMKDNELVTNNLDI